MTSAAVVATITPKASTELRDVLAVLFANYDTPFGSTQEARRAKVQGYVWACEGRSLDLVERVVRDFVSGKVKRSAAQRAKLPTAEEFAAQLDARASESVQVAAMATATYAPPFGPLWGAKLYALLLKGPDADMRKPSAFIASVIAQGGPKAESYRLSHQANNGFRLATGMLSNAGDARGCLVEEDLQHLATMVEPVPVDTPTFETWKAEHERRGWPWLPSTGKQRVVYLPKGGPAGIEVFAAAMREGGGSKVGKPAVP